MDSLLKPVYLRNSELHMNKENVSHFEMLAALNKKIGDSVKCIQLDRDLWRIYLCNSDSTTTLLTQGFEFRGKTVNVYEFNPYSSGAETPDDKVLKVTIAGVPLSVSDDAIMNMLNKFSVKVKSDLKYEKIRDPSTKKMTGVLNGNRFIYIEPLSNGKYLPRHTYCAGLRCKLFHFGQPSQKKTPLCTNCWGTDHWKNSCTAEETCKVCKETGHQPGSDDCDFFVENQKNVVAFQGKDNVLSNFYLCEVNCFGETHKSTEHAYQLVKSLRCGDVIAADKIREAKSALDAKRIGDNVAATEDWKSSCKSVMEEMITKKAEQCNVFRDKLEKSSNKSIFVEATMDDKWGSGLLPDATVHTKHSSWPGENMLGDIIKAVASKCHKKAIVTCDTPKTPK